jgi:hypothetical protein
MALGIISGMYYDDKLAFIWGDDCILWQGIPQRGGEEVTLELIQYEQLDHLFRLFSRISGLLRPFCPELMIFC